MDVRGVFVYYGCVGGVGYVCVVCVWVGGGGGECVGG